MTSMWLPEGWHTDLKIERTPAPATGSFVPSGHGCLWHITVSPWFAIDPMNRVLIQKSAYPQLLIGGRPGVNRPVVNQFLPLDNWGKALMHPAGTPETNKAGWVQIEVCATVGNAHRTVDERGQLEPFFHFPGLELPPSIINDAARAMTLGDGFEKVIDDVELCMSENSEIARAFNSGVAAFTERQYRALANLRMWITNRVDMPNRCARTTNNTKRFGAQQFIEVAGDCGHMHAPNNTHIDPTPGFQLKHLVVLSRAKTPYKL